MTKFNQLLVKAGTSTATLVYFTGLSPSAIENLRTGEHDPHITTLEAVAECLNVPVEFIEELVGRRGTHLGKPAFGKGRGPASAPRLWETCALYAICSAPAPANARAHSMFLQHHYALRTSFWHMPL